MLFVRAFKDFGCWEAFTVVFQLPINCFFVDFFVVSRQTDITRLRKHFIQPNSWAAQTLPPCSRLPLYPLSSRLRLVHRAFWQSLYSFIHWPPDLAHYPFVTRFGSFIVHLHLYALISLVVQSAPQCPALACVLSVWFSFSFVLVNVLAQRCFALPADWVFRATLFFFFAFLRFCWTSWGGSHVIQYF